MAKKLSSNPTMEELLASQKTSPVSFYRGQEVTGRVLSLTPKEIILDIGGKSDGILPTRQGYQDPLSNLQIGSTLEAYVAIPENEAGQTILSVAPLTQRLRSKSVFKGSRQIDWQKFILAQSRRQLLEGKIVEVNKGGLIIEVGGSPGFLPNSQIGFELIKKVEDNMADLVGQKVGVTVSEVEAENNKLVFTQQGQVTPDLRLRLNQIADGKIVEGKILAILPFGLFVDVGEVGGLVPISEVAWDKVSDLSNIFKLGQKVEAKVTGREEELGRLKLSIKQLSQDPFIKLAEKFSPDEVVKGEITAVSDAGVAVKLEDPSGEQFGPELTAEGLGTSGLEGFLPTSKMEVDTIYEAGKAITLLVDSVDSKRRRINLASFRTSTAGLIYK